MFISHSGYLGIVDFIKLIHHNELEQYMRNFNTDKHLCPPKEIISKKQKCFYCMDCFRYAKKKVKRYKNYYKVGNKKYHKKDLEKEGD